MGNEEPPSMTYAYGAFCRYKQARLKYRALETLLLSQSKIRFERMDAGIRLSPHTSG